MLIIAPGNWNRAGEGLSIIGQVKYIILNIIRYVPSILILAITSAVVLWRVGYKKISIKFKHKELYLLIWIFALLLLFKFPITDTRVFISLVYWWLIILAIIFIQNVKFHMIYKFMYKFMYIVLLILMMVACYYNNINKHFQQTLINDLVNSKNEIIFYEQTYIYSGFKSSCSDILNWYNLLCLDLCYRDGTNSTIYLEKSIDSDLNNLDVLFDEKNIIGSMGFYKTSSSDTFVINKDDVSNNPITVSLSGYEGKLTLQDKIILLFSPTYYDSEEFIINFNNIKFTTYNGLELGFLKIDSGKRGVVSLD